MLIFKLILKYMKKPDHTQVIGITSGQSGVGKTTVSVNLAVALHEMGYSVSILDANSNKDNAQTAMGTICPFNLEHFLSGEKTLQEIILKRRYGIGLIAGATAIQAMTSLSPVQAKRTLKEFSTLEENLDFLIVDMPPGTDRSMLSFMASTSRRFIVVRNDTAGITDAYAMIKVLCSDFKLDDIHIIVNGANNEQEGRNLFAHLDKIATKFLNHPLHYLGTIAKDELLAQASLKHQAIVEYAPTSLGARDFRHLAVATRNLEVQEFIEGGVTHFLKKLMHLHELKFTT